MESNKLRMKNKVVIVVGAGSVGDGWGNGKAAAVLYAREGAKVVCVDRDRAAAEHTCAAITAEGGLAVAISGDVTKSFDMQDMASFTVKTYGRIDVLHNNVGIAETGGPIETSEDSWDRVVAVNQTGIFLACKHVLPQMKSQQAGVIVNIGSIASMRWIGFPYAAYTASKAAVVALTQNIALQYAASGIRANCVLPGLMDTPMVRGALTGEYGTEVDEMVNARNKQTPMGKMGDAWDTAYASLFLASDEARYITGTQVVVDGGLSARCAG